MRGRVTKELYQQLVDENIAWLKRQPPRLERDRLIEMARRSIDLEYALPEIISGLTDERDTARAEVLRLQEALSLADASYRYRASLYKDRE